MNWHIQMLPGAGIQKDIRMFWKFLKMELMFIQLLNVQHLESRSETVAQITGIIVRETFPDEIFENADEVEVIDLTPDELLQRLSEGKVYTPERSKEARKFFPQRKYYCLA